MSPWLAALFLPLFPLSMAFNALFSWVQQGTLRALLLLAWPQIGLGMLFVTDASNPAWFLELALFTSALYAFRAIALREVGRWIGFLATSTWALLWVLLANDVEPSMVQLYAFGFSAPLALLTLLGARLEQEFGAAYLGLYGGLAQVMPRLSGVLVFVVLAIMAVPLFPSFSAMLEAMVVTAAVAPVAAVVIAGIWLLWTWAGIRLLQGLIVGPANGQRMSDLSPISTLVYAAVLIVLFISGVVVTGGLS